MNLQSGFSTLTIIYEYNFLVSNLNSPDYGRNHEAVRILDVVDFLIQAHSEWNHPSCDVAQ